MHHIKQVNGTTTILKQVSFSAKAGKSYTPRFSISGSTLSAKVWQTGTTEPSSWMAKASDSTFASGYCGGESRERTHARLTASGLAHWLERCFDGTVGHTGTGSGQAERTLLEKGPLGGE